MGTVHHLPASHDRPAGRDDRADDSWELELPGWDEFTAARDRFFAGLRAAAEVHRSGETTSDNVRMLADATD